MPSKKVLIILSDSDSFPLEKVSGSDAGTTETVNQPSGVFLKELAKPLQKMLDIGHEGTFASPKRHTPTVDSSSKSLLIYTRNFYNRQQDKNLIDRIKQNNGFDHPRTFSSFNEKELSTFVGIFIPGSYIPLADLEDDAELGRILRYFNRENKLTAAICHRPYALLSTTKTGDSSFVYKGYKITSWSDVEERFVETLLGGEVEKVKSTLSEHGAVILEGAPEKLGGTTLHRELVTGGNPLAASALGDRFLKMLSV